MHKLAVVHQHPDFYVDHISVVLHSLDSTISFGTVRLLLKVPLTHDAFLAGDHMEVAVCVFKGLFLHIHLLTSVSFYRRHTFLLGGGYIVKAQLVFFKWIVNWICYQDSIYSHFLSHLHCHRLIIFSLVCIQLALVIQFHGEWRYT
jgi:hypothetical protein